MTIWWKEAYSSIGLVMALNVGSIVSLCLPHLVDERTLRSVLDALDAVLSTVWMLWMQYCLLYGCFGCSIVYCM